MEFLNTSGSVYSNHDCSSDWYISASTFSMQRSVLGTLELSEIFGTHLALHCWNTTGLNEAILSLHQWSKIRSALYFPVRHKTVDLIIWEQSTLPNGLSKLAKHRWDKFFRARLILAVCSISSHSITVPICITLYHWAAYTVISFSTWNENTDRGGFLIILSS